MLKKNLLLLLIANLFLLIFVPLSQAYIGLCCAHCGGNMPLNIGGGGIPETHEFRFKVSQMFMVMGPLRDGTNDIDNADILGGATGTTFPVAPEEMRTYMTMGSVAYSFTDDFAAMAMMSYIRNEMDMEFNGFLQGATGTRGFTMTSDGQSDLTVLGKYRFFKDDTLAPTKQASLLFGLSLPTGEIEKEFTNNPVSGQNGTILPFRMQTGSGTVDPIIGLTLQGSTDPWWYGANAQLEAHVYNNDQGYRRGSELRYDFYAMHQVHSKVVLLGELQGWYEGTFNREPYRGRILGEGHAGGTPSGGFLSPLFDPQNYGGHKLAVTLGLQFQPIPLHIIEMVATLPIHQDLNGPQLRDDYMLQFTYYVEVPTKRSRRHKGFKPPKELGF
jgi:outer membrane putative beta-barrel porin/alpha-amylase